MSHTFGIQLRWRNVSLRTRYKTASLIRIAGVSEDAVADRVVVHDLALGVGSAHPRAGVDALLQRTRLVVRAVVVGGALRATADDGVALVAREAAADRYASVAAALRVRAAWRRLTGLALRFEHGRSRGTSCEIRKHPVNVRGYSGEKDFRHGTKHRNMFVFVETYNAIRIWREFHYKAENSVRQRTVGEINTGDSGERYI